MRRPCARVAKFQPTELTNAFALKPLFQGLGSLCRPGVLCSVCPHRRRKRAARARQGAIDLSIKQAEIKLGLPFTGLAFRQWQRGVDAATLQMCIMSSSRPARPAKFRRVSCMYNAWGPFARGKAPREAFRIPTRAPASTRERTPKRPRSSVPIILLNQALNAKR